MKQLLLFIWFTLGCGVLYAQLVPNYGSEIFNPFHQNAAYAGNSDDCMKIILGIKNQWEDAFKNAPNNYYFDFHTSVRNKNKRRTPSFHSVGMSVESDGSGVFGTNNIRIAYAYHFPMNKYYMMSAGTFLGYQDFRFNPNAMILEQEEDPIFENENYDINSFPTISPGLYISGEKRFFGATLFQAMTGKADDVGTPGNNTFPKYYMVNGGLKKDFGDGFDIWFTAHVKKVEGVPFYTQFNALGSYKEVVSLGVGLRAKDALVGMFRLRFLKVFEATYSYDYYTSSLYIAGAMNHEITFSVKPCIEKKKGLYCPAY